jgi:hypothetical protein
LGGRGFRGFLGPDLHRSQESILGWFRQAEWMGRCK